MRPIVKLYYYEQSNNDSNIEKITDCLKEAIQGQFSRISLVSDLAYFGYIPEFENVIAHTDDGFYKYCNTYECWVAIDDLKEALLDWMELMNLQNGELYEELISYSQGQIHNWLDSVDYSTLLSRQHQATNAENPQMVV